MKNKPVQITRNKKSKIEPFEIAKTINLTKDEENLFDALAGILEYPSEDWILRFEKCKDLTLSEDRFASEYFSDFCLDINDISTLKLQELYTRTFDLNPVCALEIGYHLFGEDYKRGEFLARLRETQNPYDLGQEHQLPDYLPVILRLLVQTVDDELKAELIGVCLIPALDRMNTAFEKKQQNPFRKIIRFLTETLKDIARNSLSEIEKVEEARFEYA